MWEIWIPEFYVLVFFLNILIVGEDTSNTRERVSSGSVQHHAFRPKKKKQTLRHASFFFNSPLGVGYPDETLYLVFDIIIA